MLVCEFSCIPNTFLAILSAFLLGFFMIWFSREIFGYCIYVSALDYLFCHTLSWLNSQVGKNFISDLLCCSTYLLLFYGLFICSAAKALDILEAYEGTLEDDYPPDSERCEHGEMLLYKVYIWFAMPSIEGELITLFRFACRLFLRKVLNLPTLKRLI